MKRFGYSLLLAALMCLPLQADTEPTNPTTIVDWSDDVTSNVNNDTAPQPRVFMANRAGYAITISIDTRRTGFTGCPERNRDPSPYTSQFRILSSGLTSIQGADATVTFNPPLPPSYFTSADIDVNESVGVGAELSSNPVTVGFQDLSSMAATMTLMDPMNLMGPYTQGVYRSDGGSTPPDLPENDTEFRNCVLGVADTIHIRYGIRPFDGMMEVCDGAGSGSGSATARLRDILIEADWGDAPDSYDTLEDGATSGPNHGLDPNSVYLGATPPDSEDDGQPGAAASSDGAEEDGVSSLVNTSATPATTYEIPVTVTKVTANTAYLRGWVDLDGDGTFTGPGEASAVIPINASGSQNLSWTKPVNLTTSDTYARFRVSTRQSDLDNPNGPAVDGEVEDYLVPASVLPVTLKWFSSQVSEKSVACQWSTASEESNMGFVVYGYDQNNRRFPLGDFVPSQSPDSQIEQNYSINATSPRNLKGISVASVDSSGREEVYGPYPLNQEVGQVIRARKVDWKGLGEDWRARGFMAQSGALEEGLAGDPDYSDFLRSVFGERFNKDYANLRVDNAGFQAVSFESLYEQGLDLEGLSPQEISVTHKGLGVPSFVYTPNSSVFGPGGLVFFRAEKVGAEDANFGNANVYRVEKRRRQSRVQALSLDQAQDGFPGEYLDVHDFEENRLYSEYSDPSDPWRWLQVLRFTSLPASQTVSLPLEADNASLPAQGQARFTGVTTGAHAVKLYWNETLVASGTAEGREDFTLDFELPPALINAENDFRVELSPETGLPLDAIQLDSVQLRRGRRLNLPEGGKNFSGDFPLGFHRQGTGSRIAFAVKDDTFYVLRGAPSAQGGVDFPGVGQADYLVFDNQAPEWSIPRIEGRDRPELVAQDINTKLLILSHCAFSKSPQLQSFVDSKPFSTQVVTVEDIYESTGHGFAGPEAIKEFLAEAKRSGGFESLLLVGADSYDRNDFTGNGAVSFVPSVAARLADGKLSASDALLADFDADGLPDVPVGRWPVRSVAELENMVGKSLKFAASLGQNTQLELSEFDDKLIYSTRLKALTAEELPDWSGRQVHPDDIAREQDLDSRAATLAANEEALNELNRGPRLVLFSGHGSASSWTFQGLFDTEDAASLTNVQAPSAYLPLACYTTVHDSPSTDALSHQLMAGESGAALITGPSALSGLGENELFARRVLQLCQEGAEIGEAIWEVKREFAGIPAFRDLILTWELLGDPSLKL